MGRKKKIPVEKYNEPQDENELSSEMQEILASYLHDIKDASGPKRLGEVMDETEAITDWITKSHEH